MKATEIMPKFPETFGPYFETYNRYFYTRTILN